MEMDVLHLVDEIQGRVNGSRYINTILNQSNQWNEFLRTDSKQETMVDKCRSQSASK
jgi:hypothetical protein